MNKVSGENSKMDNCIFCKIIRGEIDSAKIWEDDYHVAILDVYPNMRGQTLLITKNIAKSTP